MITFYIQRSEKASLLRVLFIYDLKGMREQEQRNKQVSSPDAGVCLACVRNGEVMVTRLCSSSERGESGSR